MKGVHEVTSSRPYGNEARHLDVLMYILSSLRTGQINDTYVLIHTRPAPLVIPTPGQFAPSSFLSRTSCRLTDFTWLYKILTTLKTNWRYFFFYRTRNDIHDCISLL